MTRTHRAEGEVTDVHYGKEDHGILTCYVYLKTTGFSQAFGGLCLDERTGSLFVKRLCELFGVDAIEKIKGKRCAALWSFGTWNEPMEGLEVDGRRLTITGFRREAHPELDTDKRSEKMKSLRQDVEYATRRLKEAKESLRRGTEGFVDWESASPRHGEEPK